MSGDFGGYFTSALDTIDCQPPSTRLLAQALVVIERIGSGIAMRAVSITLLLLHRAALQAPPP